MIGAQLKMKSDKQQGIMKTFLEKLKIPVQAWQMATQGYTQDPNAKQLLEKATMEA
jgi:hypothetical protein